MEPVVLVAYATRFGSTEEVAQAVAATLREDGLTVEVRSVGEVGTLEAYSGVVLGCALYMGRMHREMRRFLNENRSMLKHLPVALFVLGPVHGTEKEWSGAEQQLRAELRRFHWLEPVAQRIVGGKFDPAQLTIPFKFLPVLRRAPVSDVRDWEAVRAFAHELPGQMRLAVHG